MSAFNDPRANLMGITVADLRRLGAAQGRQQLLQSGLGMALSLNRGQTVESNPMSDRIAADRQLAGASDVVHRRLAEEERKRQAEIDDDIKRQQAGLGPFQRGAGAGGRAILDPEERARQAQAKQDHADAVREQGWARQEKRAETSAERALETEGRRAARQDARDAGRDTESDRRFERTQTAAEKRAEAAAIASEKRAEARANAEIAREDRRAAAALAEENRKAGLPENVDKAKEKADKRNDAREKRFQAHLDKLAGVIPQDTLMDPNTSAMDLAGEVAPIYTGAGTDEEQESNPDIINAVLRRQVKEGPTYKRVEIAERGVEAKAPMEAARLTGVNLDNDKKVQSAIEALIGRQAKEAVPDDEALFPGGVPADDAALEDFAETPGGGTDEPVANALRQRTSTLDRSTYAPRREKAAKENTRVAENADKRKHSDNRWEDSWKRRREAEEDKRRNAEEIRKATTVQRKAELAARDVEYDRRIANATKRTEEQRIQRIKDRTEWAEQERARDAASLPAQRAAEIHKLRLEKNHRENADEFAKSLRDDLLLNATGEVLDDLARDENDNVDLVQREAIERHANELRRAAAKDEAAIKAKAVSAAAKTKAAEDKIELDAREDAERAARNAASDAGHDAGTKKYDAFIKAESEKAYQRNARGIRLAKGKSRIEHMSPDEAKNEIGELAIMHANGKMPLDEYLDLIKIAVERSKAK